MNEETAKLLIDAANRLAAAIERATGGLGFAGGGIHIYHHNVPPVGAQPFYLSWPQTTWGGQAGSQGNGGHD